jgi:SNF2 family DNA or RNA helicase
MLLDEMGLGKTKEVIDAVGSTSLGAFVVCPNSIRRSWAREIDLHSGSTDVLVLEGTSKKRMEALCNTKARWVIVNYESLQWLEKTEPGVLAEWVKQRIVVFDEAHRLKNGLAKVTKLVSAWAPERVWLLTGTPIANKPEDLFSLISLVCPGYVGWTWYQFERAHIIRGHFNEIKAYKDIDILREKLADVSLGRRKEACIDLPEKTYFTVSCELSSAERKAYKQMYESMIAWLDEQDLAPGDRPTIAQASTWATRYLRLRQITDGMVSEGAGGAMSWSEELTKLKAAVEAWQDAGEPQAVVWYQWVPVGRKLEAMFRAAGADVYRIGGDVNANNRDVMIEQWKNRGGVLVGQMAVAGEGLNLHAADWQMFVDLPSTPKQRKQCVDRLHRIGQKRTVRIVDVVAEKTVDEVVLKSLKKKLDIADDVESAAYGQGTDWMSMLHGN